jgi:DNA-binding NtrC family response regulator
MVEKGKFREDLYYRINVVKIDTPPLQDHPEDIPQIAGHFLRTYSHLYQKKVERFEPDAMAMLQGHAWPGNVRELENVIQRALVLANGDAIRPVDLPQSLQKQSADGLEALLPAGSFERQIHDYKIRLATAAIRETHGNKTLAARSLCISRAYLHRLVRLAEPGAPFEADAQEMAID